MRNSTLALGFAALALAAAPALFGEGFRPIFHPPTITFSAVPIETAFRGTDGKTHPAGKYDFRMQQGTQGILIALLLNGKTLAEFPGKFVPGAQEPPEPDRKAGSDPPNPIKSRGHDIHFDTSSRVAFGGGGGAGKVLFSSQLHPGGANLGWIEFQLPAVQALGK